MVYITYCLTQKLKYIALFSALRRKHFLRALSATRRSTSFINSNRQHNKGDILLKE